MRGEPRDRPQRGAPTGLIHLRIGSMHAAGLNHRLTGVQGDAKVVRGCSRDAIGARCMPCTLCLARGGGTGSVVWSRRQCWESATEHARFV
jgi:hypothetical protein